MRISAISSSSVFRGLHFFKAQLLYIPVLLFSCAKIKTDTNLPVFNTLKSSNSSIRLVTLTGPNPVNMVVGGFTYNLTPNLQSAFFNCPGGFFNYQVLNFNPVPVAVPYKLVDQAGNANIRLISTIPMLYKTVERDITLKDDPSNPTDYYIFPVSKTFGDFNYNITGVPRSTTPPSGVSNIKIRLVNFSSPVDTFQLTGPLTLAYMDGTPVSNVTTGVPTGVASAYTEIPYGTYRFRIFTQTGLELPETLMPAPNLNYTISSIHSFQPGGIYTIFVNSNNIYVLGACGGNGSPPIGPPARNVSANSFTIIPDIPPPVNISYGKVQFVNTIPGKRCTLKLDNFTIGNAIGYRQVSSYRAISLGDYSMQLLDDQGQTIAQQNITLNPNDNLTVWAYVKDGQPNLAISFNDLSSPNAGQKVRFMNCSVNVPYITFTLSGQLLQVLNPSTGNYYTPDINDTTSGADAAQNLARGVSANHQPFTVFGLNGGPGYPIVVNRSDAGPPPFVPGVTLPSVRPLSGSDFVFNPSWYRPGNLPFGDNPTNPLQQYLPPSIQPGVYSVALTGLVDTTVSGHPHPDTLLIVKHFN